MDMSNVLSALVGGLLVFAAQLWATRRQTKNEEKKMKWEARREHWKAVCTFRHERMTPVFEAIDALSRRWDVNEYDHLVESLGFPMEGPSEQDETPEVAALREMGRRDARKKYQNELYTVVSRGISLAGLIDDDKTCDMVRSALYANADPDCRPANAPSLADGHKALEEWVSPDATAYLDER